MPCSGASSALTGLPQQHEDLQTRAYFRLYVEGLIHLFFLSAWPTVDTHYNVTHTSLLCQDSQLPGLPACKVILLSQHGCQHGLRLWQVDTAQVFRSCSLAGGQRAWEDLLWCSEVGVWESTRNVLPVAALLVIQNHRTLPFPLLNMLGVLPWQGMSLGRNRARHHVVTQWRRRDLGAAVARLQPSVQAGRRAEPREVGAEGAVRRRPGLG